MKWFLDKIQTEPNSLAELIRAVMYMLLGFHMLGWTAEQQSLVLIVVSAFLTFFTRRAVMPTAVIEQAGQSVMQIKKDAAAEGVRKEEQVKADKQEVQDLQAQQSLQAKQDKQEVQDLQAQQKKDNP